MVEDMTEKFASIIPEILGIKDEKLRKAVAEAYADALTTGGWSIEDMERILFTLVIPNCSVSYLAHVRAVARICHFS